MNSENNSQTTSQVVSAPSSIVTMQATRINGIATPNGASQRKHICTCTPEQLRQQKRARKESFRKVNLWD